MKVNDFVYEIFTTAQASSICGIPVIRRLTPTSVNIRIPILRLSKITQRIFGADNTGGWHFHPFDDPTRHDSLNAPMTFSEFIKNIELHFNKP